MLHRVVEAGADVLRLNFSHGTPAEHGHTIQQIRAVAVRSAKPVAVLQDLPGPKIRLGVFREGSVELSVGERFTLTTDEVEGNAERASVNYAKLAEEVREGQSILLADGNVELEVESVAPPEVHCRVILGGAVSNHKGVNVPQAALSLPALTERDRTLLQVGLDAGVDLAALSFVRSDADLASARDFLRHREAELPLMAKIEKPEALDHLDAILARVDCIMVARGDLGVEIPLAEVPLVQKHIIRKALEFGRPVITATHMLGSMVKTTRPTRAEAADVANAVLDGTDALMLSEETAVGDHPIEAIETLAAIAEAAERKLLRRSSLVSNREGEEMDRSAAIGQAACLLAARTRAAAIVCLTRTGRTAQLVSMHRPRTPIIAVSPSVRTARCLMLTWGVHPLVSEEFDSTEATLAGALKLTRNAGCVAAKDKVVMVGSASSTEPGQTDFLQVLEVS